jgi:hypothetical protein
MATAFGEPVVSTRGGTSTISEPPEFVPDAVDGELLYGADWRPCAVSWLFGLLQQAT